MRVLFIAYGYERYGKSESLSAFHLAHSIQNRGHSIEVLTGSPPTEPEMTRLETRFWLTSSANARKLKLDYFEFIARAYHTVKRLQGTYDIIHHISPISLRHPDPLANLGRPFIWGPVGGSIDYPPGFKSVSQREPFTYRLRRLDRLRLNMDPMMLNTMNQAARIVVTTRAAARLLPVRFRAKTVVIPEGIVPEEPQAPLPLTENYIFCSARLVPYKAVDLLIRAYERCRTDDVKLWISGIGPERAALERLVADLHLEQNVRFIGKIIRVENMRLMAGARFCVFPALHEAFGQVNLEAMMMKQAIIVTDWGGPADVVEDGVTGFKVLGRNPDEHVELLARRMTALLRDPTLCKVMGERARQYVLREHSWDAIACRYDQQYQSLIGSKVQEGAISFSHQDGT